MQYLEKTGLIAATIFLMFFVACNGTGGTSSKRDDSIPDCASCANAGGSALSISPPSEDTTVGETISFTVMPPNIDFTLSVPGVAGCYENANIVTCTPKIAGTYNVKVTAKSDPTKIATAILTVRAGSYYSNVVLSGNVIDDIYGNPISGALVTTGDLSVRTDSNGEFSFPRVWVVNERVVVHFEKSGYFSRTLSVVKEDNMSIEAVLYKKRDGITFPPDQQIYIELPPGMKVKAPASCIVRGDGSSYSGAVNVDMLYLDPNDENFAELMPGGDLMGVDLDNKEVMLTSWGMVNVNLADDSGNPLQIKNCSDAELTFPIPANMGNPPQQIPLWNFDEDKGIWIEIGTAVRIGDVYIGNAYAGNVSPFSWINLDVPAQWATVKGRVIDGCNNQPASSIRVKIGQLTAKTNSNGYYSAFVPANTAVKVSVTANDTKDVPRLYKYDIYNVEDFVLPCVEPITITWGYNGGRGGPRYSSFKPGMLFRALPEPVRTGYTLDGWFTSYTGGTQITRTSIVPSVNTYYYARWTSVNPVTITWDYDGGTGTPPTSTLAAGANESLGSLASLPPTPNARPGYTFTGWYTSSTGGSRITPSTSVPSADTTYYAQWVTPVTYVTITWNYNGGTGTQATSMFEAGSASFELPRPDDRNDYYFAGWYTSSTDGTRITQGYTNISNVDTTYYAQWRPYDPGTQVTYVTITWNYTEGTGSRTSDTGSRTSDSYLPGIDQLGTLPIPERRDGFVGWFTSPTGGTQITSTSIAPNADTTYYARWN